MQTFSRKENIRKEFLKKRENLKKNFSQDSKENFIKNFFNFNKDIKDKIIAGYYPIGSEICCLEILRVSNNQKIITSIPFIKEDNTIEFRKWSIGDPLAKGIFGIPSPERKSNLNPDIILIPLITFDGHGSRIGFGSGIYDRTLPLFKSSKKIGLAFSGQLHNRRLPVEDFDYPLDAVITEKKVFKFNEV